MTLQVGSIALVPFPFSDLSRSKLRPVLVLTPPDQQGDFVALAITSQRYHPGAVPIEATGLLSGSLPRPSWIRTDKVFTLNHSLVTGQPAVVDPIHLQAALSGICQLIGCTG